MIEDHGLRPELNSVELDQLTFSHPTIGNLVQNAKEALEYIFTSLYPNYKGTVPTVGDLPVTASNGDYYLVTNDGDGKLAGYIWQTRNGVSGWHKKFDQDWSTEGILTDIRNQIDPEYATLLGSTGGQILAGGKATGENLTLEANSFDDSGEIITKSPIVPDTDDLRNLGNMSKRFMHLYLSGELRDGTNAATVAQMATAYAHSQITSGNPHSVNYDELTAKIGNLVLSGDVTDVTIDLSSSGNKTATLEVKTDSHDHTTATITDFDQATWDKLKTRLKNSSGATWSFNDTNKEATLAISLSTSQVTDIESPDTDKILVGSTDGSTWRKSNGLIELTGDLTGSASYSSNNDKWTVNTATQNVPLDKVDLMDIDNMSFTSLAGLPTQLTITDHKLATGRKIRVFGTSFNGEYTVTSIDSNTISIPANTSTNETGYIIPNGGQLMYDSAAEKFKVQLENANLEHWEVVKNSMADDHLIYVSTTGRGDGTANKVTGGNLPNGNLYLESTSDTTKGEVRVADDFTPESTGKSLGSATRKFENIYLNGKTYGFKPEEVGSLPIPTMTDKGRFVQSSTGDIYFNKDGTSYQQIMIAPNFTGNEGKNLTVNSSADGISFETTVAKFDTTANLNALARSEGKIYYSTDEDKAYLDDGTSLKAFGGPAIGIAPLPIMLKGSLMASDGTRNGELTKGVNGQVLLADDTKPSGICWGEIIPSSGSTGQILTKTATSYQWENKPVSLRIIESATSTSSSFNYTVPANAYTLATGKDSSTGEQSTIALPTGGSIVGSGASYTLKNSAGQNIGVFTTNVGISYITIGV